MILYHGSDRMVTEPKLQTDAAKKELGPGFYLTPDFAQAAIAARTRVRREQRLLEKKSDYDRGVVSTFELDETVPLKVFRFESTTAEWLQFAAVNFKKRMLLWEHPQKNLRLTEPLPWRHKCLPRSRGS